MRKRLTFPHQVKEEVLDMGSGPNPVVQWCVVQWQWFCGEGETTWTEVENSLWFKSHQRVNFWVYCT